MCICVHSFSGCNRQPMCIVRLVVYISGYFLAVIGIRVNFIF